MNVWVTGSVEIFKISMQSPSRDLFYTSGFLLPPVAHHPIGYNHQMIDEKPRTK